jgi:hypothetical protein
MCEVTEVPRIIPNSDFGHLVGGDPATIVCNQCEAVLCTHLHQIRSDDFGSLASSHRGPRIAPVDNELSFRKEPSLTSGHAVLLQKPVS